MKFWDMDEIKIANERAGHHFFAPSTLRFFRSRVGDRVYQGPGGVYFVTSEQFEPFEGRRGPRRYTVRQFDPESGHVRTAGTFNKLTKVEATARARHYAEYGLPDGETRGVRA